MRARGVKFLILIIFIVAAFVSVRALGLTEYLDQERLRALIAGYGPFGPLVFMLIYSVAPSLMMPGLPITVIGGIIFGPIWGSVYVIFGATVGASVAFLIARYMGRSWVESMLKGGRLAELDARVERQGWKIVAFTRLIPLFPFNFLNYAFGLTNVRFSHYVAASFVFMLPGAVAYVVFSSSILDLFKGRISKEFVVGMALVAAVSLAPVLYRRLRRGGPDDEREP